MPRVDVLVLNYNGERFLRACLDSLLRQTYADARLILVDNSSQDGSAALVQGEFPEVEVLALERNYGFAGGNNRAIAATHSEYVALLNNDTEAEPGWLDALVEALDTHPAVGFCASRVVRISDRRAIDTAGDVFYTDGVGDKRGSGVDMDCYTRPAYVFGASGAAVLYRRSMLERIGLLDEDLFAYDEDIDLSFRAQLQGFKCLFVPNAIVFHHVGASFGRRSARYIKLVRRNMLDVLIKNMPSRLLLKYGWRIAPYYLLGDLKYSLQGYAGAVLGARWENVRALPRTLAKRRTIQRSATVTWREIDAVLTRRNWQASFRRRVDGNSAEAGTGQDTAQSS